MIKLKGVILTASFFIFQISAQPLLISPETDSYLPGERVDPNIFVYNSEHGKVRFEDLLNDDYKVVIILLMGGAVTEASEAGRRGVLWCEDSFDDLAVQRALFSFCRDKPVRFVPVAIPDVLSPEARGEENIYLAKDDEDPAFKKKFSRFTAATEQARRSSLLPFAEIFYDPRGRLVFGKEILGEVSPGYGEIFEWQGGFKWHLDARTYGLPTIWILTGEGEVACPPFWGNDYDSFPPQINYGFRELREVLEEILSR